MLEHDVQGTHFASLTQKVGGSQPKSLVQESERADVDRHCRMQDRKGTGECQFRDLHLHFWEECTVRKAVKQTAMMVVEADFDVDRTMSRTAMMAFVRGSGSKPWQDFSAKATGTGVSRDRMRKDWVAMLHDVLLAQGKFGK